MNKPAFLRLFAAAFALVAMPVIAHARAIYRCEQGRSVTYSDSPCNRPLIQSGNAAPAPALNAKQTVVGGGYEKPHGP